MNTLRTWAGWSLGYLADTIEELAEAVHLVADFVAGDVTGIEAVRDSYLYGAIADALAEGSRVSGELWEHGDSIRVALVTGDPTDEYEATPGVAWYACGAYGPDLADSNGDDG